MKNTPAGDHEIIERLRLGSMKAFEQVFVRYYPRFFSFALGMVKDEWVAEDIVQNAFMKVWLRRESLDATQSLYVYIYVLTKYEIYNYFRSGHSRQLARIAELADAVQIPSLSDVERECENAELQMRLERAVEALPERRRQIFMMSRHEFLTAGEIARRTGLSVRTVEKHIELALRDLRQKLSPYLNCIVLMIAGSLL